MLVLITAALGLPVNDLYAYFVLLVAAIAVLTGYVTTRGGRWLATLFAVGLSIAAGMALQPAPIKEGHNVFLPHGEHNALRDRLPPAVFEFMKTEFDKQYPVAKRCDPKTAEGCWQGAFVPTEPFAFSADAIFDDAAYSRNVRSIDFSDPVWLRLGFLNDRRYNWYSGHSDVERVERNRQFWKGLSRWRVTMPWFVMYEFPAAYVGSDLCWRGTVLWQRSGQDYAVLRHDNYSCRVLAAEDVGRAIFGVAIKPGDLAMTLDPPASVSVRLLARSTMKLLGVVAVIGFLVRVRWRNMVAPAVLIACALLVIAINDASIIGGWRPYDGGDDGLFYAGLGREIVQHVINGDLRSALIGGEDVFYYGGPGLRYLRAVELAIFGESNLGNLSLLLSMPIIVFGIFKRFLPATIAWPLVLVFTVLPVGEVIGTSFFHYAKWAARGFADPAAHVLFLAGLLMIVGKAREGPTSQFGPAAGAALLLAFAVFVKPIIAPMVAVMLAGAGLAALAQSQWIRVAGLSIGFLPVLAMPLHNWYFGNAFVLFSANTCVAGTCVMPPSAYLSLLGELVRLELGGEYVWRTLSQIVDWLSGPGQIADSALARAILVPIHAAAVAIVVYVAVRGRGFDPWLRLAAAAAISEYAVAMIYLPTPRYFYPMWFLTGLVTVVWLFHFWPQRFRQVRDRLPRWSFFPLSRA